ncbi:MAG: CHAP domain-containing protein [Gemmatimonas sp.]
MIQLSAIDLILRVSQASVGACEIGTNAGPYVERVLARTGNKKGEPWCAAYVADIGISALGNEWPVVRSGRVADVVAWAVKRDCSVVPAREGAGRPQIGDAFAIYFPTLGRHAHIGIVIGVNADGSIRTREGNSNDGGSREGWRVIERTRTLSVQDRLIRWVNAL